MESLNDFLGNKDAITKLVSWLNSCYHDNVPETNYCVLQGQSGNGKTLLVTLLAKSFDVELLRISPYDVTSTDDLNNFIKTVNSATLEGKKHKMILIDDFDEFPSGYMNTLCELPSISKHPIIYSCKSFYFPKDFSKSGLYVRLKKPLTSELLLHLKTISDLPEDKLKEIALESKSTRSAILSVKNATVNEVLNPLVTKRELLRSITERKLKEPITRENINFIFESIKGYDKDALQVMSRFADFDYRIKAKFEEVESIFVNEMSESIEKVKLEYKYIDNNNNSKKEKKVEVKEPKKEEVIVFVKENKNKKQKPMSTLDKFL